MDRSASLLALALGCAACASTAAPVKVGAATYMLSGTDSWAVSSENAVIERLTHQAAAHCAHEGRAMEMIDTSSNKPYGRPAQGRITYECVMEGQEAEGSAAAEDDAAE